MRMSCIHCGGAFSITAQQLGGTGRCPHCHGAVRLPAAGDPAAAAEPAARTHWLQHSLSGLLSLALHLVLILILALISYGAAGVAGSGEEVLIGRLPTAELGESPEEALEAAEVVPETQADLEELAVEPPVDVSQDGGRAEELVAAAPSSGGSEAASFELGAMAVGGGSMADGSWEGMLQSLRRDGLDVVITFDSTGSMQGEIDQVLRQIGRIGSTLLALVPKARLSICTYRDYGDEYVVRGLPLTDDLQQIEYYLSRVRADGGGDTPEAVHEGLRWAVENNQFHPRARKVILLFGDAPPHQEYLPQCLRIASDFHGQQQGLVSTVTCRSRTKLREFIEIAEVGGGESFLTADERQIITQLIVLVFGSRHRTKVLEAFELLDAHR